MRKSPEIHLTPDSPAPWVHPNNNTIDLELAAAQRVGGILITKLERSRNPEYDDALTRAGVQDLELTGIDASEESIARVDAAIYALKMMAMRAARTMSTGTEWRLSQEGRPGA